MCVCGVLYRPHPGADDRAVRFKQAVQYFYRGTLESFLKRQCKKPFDGVLLPKASCCTHSMFYLLTSSKLSFCVYTPNLVQMS